MSFQEEILRGEISIFAPSVARSGCSNASKLLRLLNSIFFLGFMINGNSAQAHAVEADTVLYGKFLTGKRHVLNWESSMKNDAMTFPRRLYSNLTRGCTIKDLVRGNGPSVDF